MHKKAQSTNLQTAPSIIVILVLSVLLLGAGAVAITSMRTTGQATGTRTVTDSNDVAVTNVSATYYADTDENGVQYTLCSAIAVYNGTNARVATGNATFSNNNCSAIMDANYPSQTMEFNYTGTRTTYLTAYNASTQGLIGVDNMSTQLPTVGTMLGVGLLLAVVIGVFVLFQRRA